MERRDLLHCKDRIGNVNHRKVLQKKLFSKLFFSQYYVKTKVIEIVSSATLANILSNKYPENIHQFIMPLWLIG